MQLLPLVVKDMRAQFPDARAFGATMHYWCDAHARFSKKRERARAIAKEQEQEHAATLERTRESEQRAFLQRRWDSLSPEQRSVIRDRVRGKCSNTVRQFLDQKKFADPLVMLACLEQLAESQSPPQS